MFFVEVGGFRCHKFTYPHAEFCSPYIQAPMRPSGMTPSSTTNLCLGPGVSALRPTCTGSDASVISILEPVKEHVIYGFFYVFEFLDPKTKDRSGQSHLGVAKTRRELCLTGGNHTPLRNSLISFSYVRPTRFLRTTRIAMKQRPQTKSHRLRMQYQQNVSCRNNRIDGKSGSYRRR